MGKAELFSYLSAFVTIVIALALTNILQSTSLLIQSRRRVRWDLRPVVFALIVLVALVSEFFSIWLNLSVTSVTMGRLLWLILIPALFAILAYAVLPNEVPGEGIDLGRFFDDERQLWALLFGTIALLDAGRSIDGAYRQDVPLSQMARWLAISTLPIVVPGFIALAVLYCSNKRRWHWVSLTILSAWVLAGTMFSTISVAPAQAG